jgi:putative flippase GtrA
MPRGRADVPARKDSVVGYLASGGIAAAANYGSRFVFSAFLPFEAAVVAAYAVGMVTAFVLMRRFAFQAATGSTRAQLTGFCLVNLAAALQTLAVSSLLARLVLPAAGVPGDHEAISHAVGVAVPVLTSYFGHRYLSFR